MKWVSLGLMVLGVLGLVFVVIAVGISHGVRTMGYAKPWRWWFWRRG